MLSDVGGIASEYGGKGEVNVIFKVGRDERGLLELRTADLSDKSFQELRALIWYSKRVVISTKSGCLGTSLCFTIDDSYEPPPIERSEFKE